MRILFVLNIKKSHFWKDKYVFMILFIYTTSLTSFLKKAFFAVLKDQLHALQF